MKKLLALIFAFALTLCCALAEEGPRCPPRAIR